VKKDYAEFYKASMMYLAFIASDSLAVDFKLPLAVDIGLAALLGEGIYSFAQLLMHPIVKVCVADGWGVSCVCVCVCVVCLCVCVWWWWWWWWGGGGGVLRAETALCSRTPALRYRARTPATAAPRHTYTPPSPRTQVLDGSPYKWLHEMLEVFNRGDLHAYDALCSKYAAVLNAQPALVEHERRLREKVRGLGLLNARGGICCRCVFGARAECTRRSGCRSAPLRLPLRAPRADARAAAAAALHVCCACSHARTRRQVTISCLISQISDLPPEHRRIPLSAIAGVHVCVCVVCGS
jgi:hypothetical protein